MARLEEAYNTSIEPLSDAESAVFGRVVVVGTRFYSGLKIYHGRPKDKRFLFLVPDVGNAHDVNAIMLHTGDACVGHASRGNDLSYMRSIIKGWGSHASSKESTSYIVVCELKEQLGADLIVSGIGRVNERAARKYVAKLNKGM